MRNLAKVGVRELEEMFARDAEETDLSPETATDRQAAE